VIGLGLHDALRFAVPNLPAERYPLMVERYRHHYLQHDHELQLFDGAAAMIAELAAAGFLLAVATGKSRIGLDRALRSSGLGPYFHASRCADECFSKPHPQMLEELMDELSVDPERTLMIGDTTHDLLMGKNAGVACLAAGYGAHPAAALDALAPWPVSRRLRRWRNGCESTPDLPVCRFDRRRRRRSFHRPGGESEEPAFAVRFRGRVAAYLNRCGHVPVELDWQPNEFFDDSKLYLICATHGALVFPSRRSLSGRPL
jgi:phosphoglycolate phosphatase